MFKRFQTNVILRIGLGITFLYAGIDSLTNPRAWIGFVPIWVENFVSRDIFLAAHGIIESLLGIALILGFLKTMTAIIALIDLAAILVISGINDITFRDIGLIAIALTLIPKKRHRRPPK